LTNTLLLVSIVYAVYRYSIASHRRQIELEQEFKSARELQQMLIPEILPDVPGFALTGAYRPAQEVGGDFFQIIPLEDSSTLVVLGDVSGKGLKSAMTVSLIVGAIRALVDDHPGPARLLAELNRRLYGRMQGGFATCLILRVYNDGSGTVASAGHPAPFLNGKELNLPGALPLGLAPTACYEETALRLREGDCVALYTDGMLEARNQSGELYGFKRLEGLLVGKPDAGKACEAAVNFGQDDDITVLIFTRLATGEESTGLQVVSGVTPA
jgi:serine phosphatase RsbU (regulator of sigma subunit)